MIARLEAMGEIEVQQGPMRRGHSMTGEDRRLQTRGEHDQIGTDHETAEAPHLPMEVYLLDRLIFRRVQMAPTAAHRQSAEVRPTTRTRTFRITTAGRRAMRMIAADAPTREILMQGRHIEIRTGQLLVTANATETEIELVIRIRGGRGVGVPIGRGVSGRIMRDERDCKTVSVSFIDDEANVRGCSGSEEGKIVTG